MRLPWPPPPQPLHTARPRPWQVPQPSPSRDQRTHAQSCSPLPWQTGQGSPWRSFSRERAADSNAHHPATATPAAKACPTSQLACAAPSSKLPPSAKELLQERLRRGETAPTRKRGAQAPRGAAGATKAARGATACIMEERSVEICGGRTASRTRGGATSVRSLSEEERAVGDERPNHTLLPSGCLQSLPSRARSRCQCAAAGAPAAALLWCPLRLQPARRPRSWRPRRACSRRISWRCLLRRRCGLWRMRLRRQL